MAGAQARRPPYCRRGSVPGDHWDGEADPLQTRAMLNICGGYRKEVCTASADEVTQNRVEGWSEGCTQPARCLPEPVWKRPLVCDQRCVVRQDAALKQREADARLLGQRAALRAQRAAELIGAEAHARARAVEFEGPVMRALMQDKVRTPTTGHWSLPLTAVLPCRL